MDMLLSLLKATTKQTLTSNDIKKLAQQSAEFKQQFFQLVKRHKLEFLFYDLIKNLGLEDLIDESVVNQYIEKFEVLQVKYFEYLNALKPMFTMLEQECVPYAVLKGFSFMDELYETKEGITRRFADIDILIDRSDVNVVKKILGDFNFLQGRVVGSVIIEAKRNELLYWEINSHQLHQYVKLSSKPKYVSKYWIEVDINTTFFEGGKFIPPIETKSLLTHTILKSTKSGVIFSVLNNTYSLIQLCYHFYKDTNYESKKVTQDNYSLIKFCDIRKFILHNRQSIDWGEFVEVVNQAKINDQIYYSLWLVSSFFGDLEIEPLLERIKSSKDYSANEIDWEKFLL